MLDIFALTFSLFAIAAFMHGFRRAAAASVVRACRDRLRPVDRLQMERAVRARGLHRHRRRDPPDARLAHAIRRRPAGRLVPARSLARFQMVAFRHLLRAHSGGRLSRDVHSALRFFVPGYSASATADLQRQHHDRDRGPHLYEFMAVLAVPGAPGLVSLRQDRRRPDRRRRLSRQPADPVAGADCGRDLPARLDRDAAGRCLPGAGVLFRPIPRMGVAAANARVHLLLPSGGDHGELCAGLCLETRQHARAGCYGPMLRSVLPALPQCCRYRPRS